MMPGRNTLRGLLNKRRTALRGSAYSEFTIDGLKCTYNEPKPIVKHQRLFLFFFYNIPNLSQCHQTFVNVH